MFNFRGKKTTDTKDAKDFFAYVIQYDAKLSCMSCDRGFHSFGGAKDSVWELSCGCYELLLFDHQKFLLHFSFSCSQISIHGLRLILLYSFLVLVSAPQ